jgi:SLOG in TRPM, prokaryote/SMODS and SLOG-associating 2TM effector domain 1/Protein of unknown function (DUF4231)
VNVPAGPDTSQPVEVRFDNGNRAVVLTGARGDAQNVLVELGLQEHKEGRPVIIVCGGADGLRGAALTRAREVLGPAVSAAAKRTGAAVVDGGTASGVMEITGRARAQRPDSIAVLVGVAPRGKVTYPGGPAGDGAPLEENHSHFALADSAEWGGETRLLIALADALALGRRQVAVALAGGGHVAKAEILESVRRGWPVFVVAQTGGLADSILQYWNTYRAPNRRRATRLLPPRYRNRKRPPLSSIQDASLREIVDTGDIRLVTGSEPGQFARQLAWEVQDQPVLKAAWQQFATYDHLATRLRAAFTRFQAWILTLGVIATLLALIHNQIGGQALHWVVVVLPILASVLIALASRNATGQRWVMLRAAAEGVKTEIYRYRTLPYAHDGNDSLQDEPIPRQEALAAQLAAIDVRLMQTQASSGPLTPYDGPLPPKMYGAGQDDDGLSPLSPESYLRIRVADQLTYYHSRIRSLSVRRNVFQFLAIAAGGAGAILAAADFEVWIGLTSAISASALAYMAYLQVDNTIVTYNQAAARLIALQRAWLARGAGQRDPQAFVALVTNAETVLTTELGGWVQQMNEALRELADRQADAAKLAESPPDTNATRHSRSQREP